MQQKPHTLMLLIASTADHAGKTMIGLGIGQNYPGKVGVFKPVGTDLVNGIDRDVCLFKEVFKLKEAPDRFSISIDRHILRDKKTDFNPLLKERFCELSQGKDFMIIEAAHTMSYGSYAGLSAPQIAQVLGCPGLLIAEGTPEKVIDKSLMARHCFAVRDAALLGVVVNRADVGLPEKLHEKGIHVLGVIPEYKALSVPTCEDIVSELDGELLAGEKGLHKKVETTVLGDMTFDSARKTLQQIKFPENSVMVTGGDQKDMHMFAFYIKSSLLVLTGGTPPSADILAKAEKQKIPVVMVTGDTMTTASRCEQATAVIRPSHAARIKEIVKTHVDLERIFEAVEKSGFTDLLEKG
jgi:BioD-like phosphotransacetylase family protein